MANRLLVGGSYVLAEPRAWNASSVWPYYCGAMARLGLAALGLVLALLAAEAMDRMITHGTLRLPPPTWIADADLLYVPNPEVDSESLTGGPVGSPQATRKRIVCMGGSTTAGYRVHRSEAWPAQTERFLRAHGVAADVINAAVPGYGSRQLLLRYRREIALLRPQVVLIYEGWNRTGALVDEEEFVPLGVSRPGEGLAGRLAGMLGRHSLLVQHFAGALERLRMVLSRDRWTMDRYHDAWEADIRALVREVREQGRSAALVVYPALYHTDMTPAERAVYEPHLWLWKRYKAEMLVELGRKHEALRAIAPELGAVLIDVQSELGDLRGEERLRLFADEMHLSVAGNERVGAIIGAKLLELTQAQELPDGGA